MNTTHIWVTYNAEHRAVAANETRILIWLAGWEMIKDHPWGVGQGNVSRLFPQYVAGTPIADREPNVPHLHDNFLQILAQNGWQGLAVYLLWIAVYGWTALRARPPSAEGAEMNWVLFCVFIGVLVWGLTEYTFSHQFMNFQSFLLGLQVRLWSFSPRNGNAKGSKVRRTRFFR